MYTKTYKKICYIITNQSVCIKYIKCSAKDPWTFSCSRGLGSACPHTYQARTS